MKNKKYLLKFYLDNKEYSRHTTNKIKLEGIFNNHVIFKDGFIDIYNNNCFNYKIYTLKYKKYSKNKDNILYIELYDEYNKILSTHILIKYNIDYQYRIYTRKTIKINGNIFKNEPFNIKEV